MDASPRPGSGLGRPIAAGTSYALLAGGSVWGGITMVRDAVDGTDIGFGGLCFCFAAGCAVAALRRLRGRPASLASGFPMLAIGGSLLVACLAGEAANIRNGHPLGDWHDAWKPLTLVMAFWATPPLVRRFRARKQA